MYDYLERNEDGTLTEEQKAKITPEDAEKHFMDLYNLHPLYEGHEEAFSKILMEVGYTIQNITKMKVRAALASNWRKNNHINVKMERCRLTPFQTASFR